MGAAVVWMRVVLSFLAAVAATACVQDDPPAQLASVPVSAAASPISVPPDRWSAVLVAGDSSSPAFNNGVETMRDRLAGEGVRTISLLAADPSGMMRAEVASGPNVRRALQRQGGGACFTFMTSHGDQRGFFLRASRMLGTLQDITERKLAEARLQQEHGMRRKAEQELFDARMLLAEAERMAAAYGA